MAGRRCAEWRFPTAKQARAEEVARRLAENQRRRAGVDDGDAWWESVLSDPRATAPSRPLASRTLAEIRGSELKVSCLKCVRTVAISREEALRRYDRGSVWKEVAVRLLADGCQHRTGRHEEDGCWPDFRG